MSSGILPRTAQEVKSNLVEEQDVPRSKASDLRAQPFDFRRRWAVKQSRCEVSAHHLLLARWIPLLLARFEEQKHSLPDETRMRAGPRDPQGNPTDSEKGSTTGCPGARPIRSRTSLTNPKASCFVASKLPCPRERSRTRSQGFPGTESASPSILLTRRSN